MADLVNLKLWKHWSPKAETSHACWLAEVVIGHQAARSSSVLQLHADHMEQRLSFAHSVAVLRFVEPCQVSQWAKIPKLTLNLGLRWDEPPALLGFPEPKSHPGWKPCCSDKVLPQHLPSQHVGAVERGWGTSLTAVVGGHWAKGMVAVLAPRWQLLWGLSAGCRFVWQVVDVFAKRVSSAS